MSHRGGKRVSEDSVELALPLWTATRPPPNCGMRKFVAALAVLLLALVIVVTVRTVRFAPVPRESPSETFMTVEHDSLLAAYLAGAIRFPTISR